MTYELTYLVPADITKEKLKEIIEKVNKFILEIGAEILPKQNFSPTPFDEETRLKPSPIEIISLKEKETETALIVKRRLSYPIKKKTDAFYISVNFKLEKNHTKREENLIKKMGEKIKTINVILQHLIIKYKKPKLVARKKISIIKEETKTKKEIGEKIKTIEKPKKLTPKKAEKKLEDLDKELEKILNI